MEEKAIISDWHVFVCLHDPLVCLVRGWGSGVLDVGLVYNYIHSLSAAWQVDITVAMNLVVRKVTTHRPLRVHTLNWLPVYITQMWTSVLPDLLTTVPTTVTTLSVVSSAVVTMATGLMEMVSAAQVCYRGLPKAAMQGYAMIDVTWVVVPSTYISTCPFLSWCADINECMEQTAACNQVCENTVPGYNCACYIGYELGADMATCMGKCGSDDDGGTACTIR